MRFRFDEIYERLNSEIRISTKTAVRNSVVNWTNSLFSFFELISIEKKTYENFVRTIEKRDEFFVWKRFYDLKSKSSLQTTISIDAETKIRFKKQKRTQFSNSFENETKSLSIAMKNRQQSSILIENETEFLNDQMKKKNWRSFRFRSKKKRNHFVSSKNVRSYRFWSKMKRNFFVFRKMNFRSCRFRSKMKSNSRSRERTINSFRMKLKFRTIRKKKAWWKTSISKFCFSSLVADKSCFRRFDFKSKKIR